MRIIFIRGYHKNSMTFRCLLMCNGANDIISFKSGVFQNGDMKSLNDAFDVGNGIGDIFRHFLTVCLVICVYTDPFCFLGGVKYHSQMRRFLF